MYIDCIVFLQHYNKIANRVRKLSAQGTPLEKLIDLAEKEVELVCRRRICHFFFNKKKLMELLSKLCLLLIGKRRKTGS